MSPTFSIYSNPSEFQHFSLFSVPVCLGVPNCTDMIYNNKFKYEVISK